MASSHHSYSSYPAFQLRYPLGKSFATAGLKQHSPTRPRTAPSSDKHHSYAHHPPRPESSAAKRNTAPQQRTRTGDEYVKNLQQQIYLLELETRYLRAGRSDDGTPFPLASGPRSGTPPTSDRAAPAAPLGEVIQDLRGKYVELQEGYRQEVETLKSDLQALQTTHASSTQQLSTLKSQVASLTSQLAKSESTASRDRESLQMELSAAKQRLDAAGAEVERWEGLYEDGVAACEELRKDAVKMEAVLSSEKNKVFELESVNKRLEKRIEELCEENSSIKHAAPPAPSDTTSGSLRALQATLTTLQASLTSLNETHSPQGAHITNITTQLQVAQHANKALSVRVEELTSELTAAQSRASTSSTRNTELERQTAHLTADLTRATSARTSLTSRLASLTALTAAHQQRIAQLESQMQTLSGEKTKAASECETHLKEFEQTKTRNADLEAELEQVKAKLKQVKRLEDLVRVAEERGEGYIEVVRQLKGGLRDGGVWTV